MRELFNSLMIPFEEVAICKTEASQVNLRGADGSTAPLEIELQFAVGFTGCANGGVAIRSNSDGAADLTRGLLMMEPEDELDAADIEDALGEFANMTAGSLKTAALDPRGEFHLGLPTKLDSWDHDCWSVGYKLSSGAISIELVLGKLNSELV